MSAVGIPQTYNNYNLINYVHNDLDSKEKLFNPLANLYY